MRSIPACATAFVAQHEGVRLDSYLDPGGVWTVGYGHTGPEVDAGLRISRVRAETWLREDLETAARRLGAVVSAEVVAEVTEHQYAALLSFVFNLGASPKWTIWKRLNARQFDQVPVEMARFVYVGETKLQGLVKRRAAEIALWSTEEPGSAPDAPPSSYTRAEATPPAAAEPAPLVRQPAFVAALFATVLAAPEALAKVTAALTPYAASSRAAAETLALLADLSPFVAAAGAFVLWLQSRQSKL
jgi:lysozyme